MFDLGEKIVCINDTWQAWVRDTYNQLPVKGEIYTVRALDLGRTDLAGNSDTSFKVLLEELHNDDEITPSGRNVGELGFRSDRFATLEQIQQEESLTIAEAVEGTKVLVQ